MNLPLDFGWLGILEAALIALAVGVLVCGFWQWLLRRGAVGHAQAIGWAMACAVVVGAGIDAWHLFYLGMVKLESPLYARIALQAIHDPDVLGLRVVMEMIGACCGVLLGLALFGKRVPADASPT